ncbi:bacillithiol biosynthesis cysteine-adding enzyme BshC [Persicobacter psychrovividus]|uniref:Putative cysteine ligase BshC n=1 Tax=Persicobacter psychrovividus TaxID=387638 RepID=A0ABM7VBG6_9BACT|nr:putative cysteine ligase BshC [Persicobacter psychrovividus]
MTTTKIALKDTHRFSSIFMDYLDQHEALKPFYHRFPNIENFKAQIEEKSKAYVPAHRMIMSQVLRNQYAKLERFPETKENIRLLMKDRKTFTVTTGHQLNIFTGPLYFIFKIVSVINTCKALKEAYPDCTFVPVYWMASEDHDFAEIAYFHLFGKKYEWETEQTGAVGRMNPQELKAIIEQLPEAVPLFEEAYLQKKTLAEAVAHYVNTLFGKDGLVVIDADDKNLKALFRPVIRREIFDNESAPIIEATSERLVNAGYKAQVHPREINFFYLFENTRERLVRNDNGDYDVLNRNWTMTKEELDRLIERNPERFSPNVAMRPLYQEWILPNLAYCGGPGELAYWLQLKDMFEHFKVPFPILLPRHFGMVFNKNLQNKWEKTGAKTENIFEDLQTLKANYIQRNSENEVSLEKEMEAIKATFAQIAVQAESIDQSLQGFIGAEEAKTLKSIGNIEKRLKKSEERKHETGLKQIEAVLDKLFPNGGLQERHENFLNFYLNNDQFIEEVKEAFTAFDFRFTILS